MCNSQSCTCCTYENWVKNLSYFISLLSCMQFGFSHTHSINISASRFQKRAQHLVINIITAALSNTTVNVALNLPMSRNNTIEWKVTCNININLVFWCTLQCWYHIEEIFCFKSNRNVQKYSKNNSNRERHLWVFISLQIYKDNVCTGVDYI